jgi:phosphoesterase RecJ-like protein
MSDARQEMLGRIREAILARRRFVISSHARPDGDSIGSQLAMAFALRELGREVQIVNADPAPEQFIAFPGTSEIQVAQAVRQDFDAAIIMECSSLGRTGVSGLDRFFVINIDHHPGNSMFGAINWFDGKAAACGEMVFDVVRALGVPLTPEIATHIYVAILTDTGSFHYSSISARTFDICRQAIEAGVNPEATARQIYDSSTLGRLKLLAAVLNTLEIDDEGRTATIYMDRQMAQRVGATYDDTEGLVNLPLTVKEIEAVALFKETGDGEWRVSLRSKGDVNVATIAAQFGGGGHKNAAGCTVHGRLEEARPMVAGLLREVFTRR